MKRTDYISWDEYFMGVALLAARRSKDPNTQVGACIVSPDNIILSTGYNGLPCSCSDDVFPWEREGAETKYPYVVHAELNAILNAGGRVLRGARLYVALFPCNECAKAIIQSASGRSSIFSDKYAENGQHPCLKAHAGRRRCALSPSADGACLHHTGFPRAGKRRDPAEKRRGRKIILYFSVILCYDITAGNFAGTSTRSVLGDRSGRSIPPART